MHPFVRASGAVESLLEDEERRVLGHLFADVAAVVAGSSGRPPAARPADQDRAEPSDPDAARLAALDFDPVEPDEVAPTDPGLARVLPVASVGDPEAAAEFRRLAQADLRREKSHRLLILWQELEAPTGRDGSVRVAEGDEGLWLAALSDVRQFLAGRLHVKGAADARRVEELALSDEIGVDEDAQVEAAMAGLYVALAWWQESLLQALRA